MSYIESVITLTLCVLYTDINKIHSITHKKIFLSENSIYLKHNALDFTKEFICTINFIINTQSYQ